MKKSCVTMEQHYCPICTEEKDTGAILMDERLRKTFERHTTTGMGICNDCQEKLDDGFIAMLEVDPTKSEITPNGKITPENAYRTSDYLWMRRAVAESILSVDVKEYPFIYIEPEVMAMFKEMSQES